MPSKASPPLAAVKRPPFRAGVSRKHRVLMSKRPCRGNPCPQCRLRAELFGRVIRGIRFFAGGKIALLSVLKEDFIKTGAGQDETEGFTDFAMSIRGVDVGVCIMETGGKFKVSFRSRKTDVNAVAGVFGGGGHTLASGCQISGEYEEAVDRIVCAVKRFLEE